MSVILDVDVILDKISKNGLSSATLEEWNFIKEELYSSTYDSQDGIDNTFFTSITETTSTQSQSHSNSQHIPANIDISLVQEEFSLIAIDIIESLDDNFYVVDINGYIGLHPINQHLNEFESNLYQIFKHKDIYLKSVLEKSKQPRVIIKNEIFPYENKLVWRKLKIKSPQINKEIKPHNYKNYPKYLLKPNFGWQAIGIELYNELPDNFNNNCFIEEFIPSKLIDNHCYSIRVIVIANEKDFYPILYSNRKCLNPIIENLKGDKLSDKDRFSYISNINSDNQDYIINNDTRLKEFVSNLKFSTKV